MSIELIQTLASLVHDLIELTPESAAIRKRAADATRQADRMVAEHDGTNIVAPMGRHFATVTPRMLSDMAALALPHEPEHVILSLPSACGAAPASVWVYISTHTDPELIGKVEP